MLFTDATTAQRALDEALCVTSWNSQHPVLLDGYRGSTASPKGRHKLLEMQHSPVPQDSPRSENAALFHLRFAKHPSPNRPLGLSGSLDIAPLMSVCEGKGLSPCGSPCQAWKTKAVTKQETHFMKQSFRRKCGPIRAQGPRLCFS